MTDRDEGSATVLVASLLAVIAVLAMSIDLLGSVVLARHRAESAADLAALAAADLLLDPLAPARFGGAGADPCRQALLVAEANGARLVECRGDLAASVTVRVAVALPGALGPLGPAFAVARAGSSPSVASTDTESG